MHKSPGLSRKCQIPLSRRGCGESGELHIYNTSTDSNSNNNNKYIEKQNLFDGNRSVPIIWGKPVSLKYSNFRLNHTFPVKRYIECYQTKTLNDLISVFCLYVENLCFSYYTNSSDRKSHHLFSHIYIIVS